MRSITTLCCGLLFVSLTLGQTSAKREYVPDEETAVKIAEAVLTPVYGKAKFESERPFTAKLKDGVWEVSGTLHCQNSDGHDSVVCKGGVAVVKISKSDARIISMIHYK